MFRASIDRARVFTCECGARVQTQSRNKKRCDTCSLKLDLGIKPSSMGQEREKAAVEGIKNHVRRYDGRSSPRPLIGASDQMRIRVQLLEAKVEEQGLIIQALIERGECGYRRSA